MYVYMYITYVYIYIYIYMYVCIYNIYAIYATSDWFLVSKRTKNELVQV